MGKGAAEGYGRAIRTARAWAGVTQGELAQRVGVRQETVSSWESGKTEPSLKMWQSIAREMAIPSSVFILWAQGTL